MSYLLDTLKSLAEQTALANLGPGNYLMIVVACVFLYLAIRWDYEPLLLIPIAFGMLLVNIYPAIMEPPQAGQPGGLLHYFFMLDEQTLTEKLNSVYTVQ